MADEKRGAAQWNPEAADPAFLRALSQIFRGLRYYEGADFLDKTAAENERINGQNVDLAVRFQTAAQLLGDASRALQRMDMEIAKLCVEGARLTLAENEFTKP